MFTINERNISLFEPPYVIAELSANHNGDIDRAYEIISSAKENGAHAVKFQAYTPLSMTIKCDKSDFQIRKGPWAGSNLYDLYKQAGTPLEWQKDLFSYSNELGITCFSTPFDEAGVELLNNLNAPAFKVASFEMADHALLNKIGQTKKPVLMSTGLANLSEIEESINVLQNAGNKDLLIFHCISSYPAPIEQSHLSMIPMLRQKFNIEVGLSDHTMGTTAAIVAVSLGASAIEKHFTKCRADGGADSEFSLEPNELQKLVVETENAWLSLGNDSFERSLVEEDNIIFRRSLYFIKKLKKGDVISSDSVKSIRPGYGIAPKYLSDIVGGTVLENVTPGDRVSWDIINHKLS